MKTTTLTNIKKELDVDTFLDTLTIESTIENLKQFIVSGWFLLKIVGVIFYFIFSFLFKWGQQLKIYCTPFINKVYLTSKTIDNPVAQFIAGLTQPKDIDNLPLAQLDVNNSVFPSTYHTPKDLLAHNLDSQNQQLTHT
jgi:hypothetical protein